MKFILILLIFLLIGALFIISNENLHLREKEEAKKFAGLYYSWLFDIGKNVASVTAFVIKFDWLPSQQDNNDSSSDN